MLNKGDKMYKCKLMKKEKITNGQINYLKNHGYSDFDNMSKYDAFKLIHEISKRIKHKGCNGQFAIALKKRLKV
jgi:hypothetical protein